MIGMATAVILGPVFFTLLRNSLQKGVSAGLLTAFGIVISDVAVAAICYFFAGSFLNEYVDLPIVKFVAAGILISFGFTFIRKPINDLNEKNKAYSKSGFTSFIQGFLVNFVNPAVFLLWIAFITLAQSQYTDKIDVLLYLLGILLGVFLTDALKAVGAAFFAPYLKSTWLKMVFKILGFVLFGIAAYFVYQGISQFF